MTVQECLRCGARRSAEDGDPGGDRVCSTCGGPLRDLALPQE